MATNGYDLCIACLGVTLCFTLCTSCMANTAAVTRPRTDVVIVKTASSTAPDKLAAMYLPLVAITPNKLDRF